MAAPVTVDLVRALLQTRSALLADVDPAPEAGERLLVRTDVAGTMQLHELSEGALIELTALPEPVAGAHYLPGGRRVVLEVDQGGNERHQLYLLDLSSAAGLPVTGLDEMHALTAQPRFGHHFAGVSPDGRLIAYVSNRANGIDFDLWLCEPASGEHRLLYADRAYLQPGSGFSPDGRLVSVLRPGDRPLDLDLVLVDAATGESRMPLEHPGEAALVGAPAWVGPATFYASSNAGRDFAAIVHHDLATGITTTVAGAGEEGDADVVAARDGSRILIVENRDGADRMQLCEVPDGTPAAIPAAPEAGVVASHAVDRPVLSADGTRV